MHNIIRFLLTPETEVNLEQISMTWAIAVYIQVYRNTNKPVAEKTMRNNILDYAIHLTYWGRDEMDNISQTTFSNTFSWMKMYELQFKFIEVCSLGFN